GDGHGGMVAGFRRGCNCGRPLVVPSAAHMSAPRAWLAVLTLLGCGSKEPGPWGPPVDVGVPGVAVMKARSAGADYLLLLEKLVRLPDVEEPPRSLRRFGVNGPPLDFTPPPGATLADFAAAPGGDVSVLLASDTGFILERWSADGARGAPVDVGGVAPPRWSHDAGRLAPLGEDV